MISSAPEWPEWWGWELDCTNPHLAKRMVDRSFTETDLREMLESATGYRVDAESGRWVIETMWLKAMWEVIVEPDAVAEILLVVTAYKVG